MQEAFRTLLLTEPSIAALAGRLVDWDVIPQGKAGPAAVLILVSDVIDYHMQGPSGLVQSRVQIDCRASTKAPALALARAIERLLSGYTGTIGAVRFQGIFKDSGRSRHEKTGAEEFFTESADYLIWHGAVV